MWRHYYIKNFTGSSAIKNCAGDGISIQNLNATTKFEIKNCTIEDCTGSGVFFNNLTNGTIKNSTVQNNTDYGIEVGLVSLDSDDPDHVNITNNTIDDNNYGIELIGFNCTVKNNTISNSTEQGIYLFGNYTNITNNTIQDNTDYGVKAYNSYHNNIYYNNFYNNTDSDNNGGQNQAWDNKNGDVNNWDDGTEEANTGNYWYLAGTDAYSIDGGVGQEDEYPSNSPF